MEHSGTEATKHRIYVVNLPFDMSSDDVKELFNDNVGEVTHIELYKDEKAMPRGCGFLEFSTESFVEEAIQKMHNHALLEFNGRKIVVKKFIETKRDNYGQIIKEHR